MDVVSRHASQLDHYAVPEHLREIAIKKLMNEEYGAPWTKQDLKVVAAETISPEQDIWVLDHSWLFQSAKDAAVQLKENENLREELTTTIQHFAKTSMPSSIDELVEWIVVHLVHCAYSIKFGHEASDLYHYVHSNLGSILSCSNTMPLINIQVVPFYYMDTNKLVSLMWATKPINCGDELVRPHATKISLIQLGKQSYWESRYEEEEEFDWYCGYNDIKDILKRHLDMNHSILLVGTGSSTLPIDMENDGYKNLIAMDYASNVVEKLCLKYSNSNVHFIQADMTMMKNINDNEYDCILDKGCLDTMLLAPETQVESNVWKTVTNSNAIEFPDASAALLESIRIVKPNGKFLFISYGNPMNRIGLFDWFIYFIYKWELIECIEMSPKNCIQNKSFFIYILKKILINI